jgi:small subunit ribosomal protein S21
MAKIQLRPGETIESALRRFNNEVLRDGIMLELQKRQFYQKPSLVKKLENEERRRNGKARNRTYNGA